MSCTKCRKWQNSDTSLIVQELGASYKINEFCSSKGHEKSRGAKPRRSIFCSQDAVQNISK